MEDPLVSHWRAVKRMLYYLNDTISHGLVLAPAAMQQQLSPGAYIDSDWVSNLDDMRSTSGSNLYLGPNLVAWSLKKQPLVAHSSAEAE